MIGNVVSTSAGPPWEQNHRFDNGAIVGVENGLVANVIVDFRNGGSYRFHYNGVGRNATENDVREILGPPSNSDGISYTYCLNGGTFDGILFNVTFDDDRRVDNMMLSHRG